MPERELLRLGEEAYTEENRKGKVEEEKAVGPFTGLRGLGLRG